MSVKEDLEANYERAERARKQLDAERSDLQSQISTLEAQVRNKACSSLIILLAIRHETFTRNFINTLYAFIVF